MLVPDHHYEASISHPGESSLVSFSISFADPDSSETRNYAHPTHFPLLADT